MRLFAWNVISIRQPREGGHSHLIFHICYSISCPKEQFGETTPKMQYWNWWSVPMENKRIFNVEGSGATETLKSAWLAACFILMFQWRSTSETTAKQAIFWWKRDAWAPILPENANYNSKDVCARLLMCILLFWGIQSLLPTTQFPL